ncbi:MAG: chemotaxis protein CheW [Gemmatimonas sp.]|jgi:chemotaxis signal transduction protein|uniref:chemotaxis protein CheW n=1 Tax=Gemmatimonas sp. TaxID=1962908 RepID=UPI00391F919B|nr:chemotaxis protein CheW [Gemmatimonadota bacterium]
MPLPAEPAEGDESPQWLVVEVGRVRYGIPVEQVRGVVRPGGLRPVPGAPVQQAGIVNVRGAIVTVLDLAAMQSGTRAVAPGSIVLLQNGARPIGLTVDAVHDVRVVETGEAGRAGAIVPLDAVALCARHLHSGEARER